MINWIGFRTLVLREITRFLSVYRQTVIPGLISSGLYIIIFGLTLQRRILFGRVAPGTRPSSAASHPLMVSPTQSTSSPASS